MRASLFFSRDFPHQVIQRFGEYFPTLSLGLPMEPFSIRQTACCRIFLLMFQHRTVAKQPLMAGVQRRRKAARSRGFACREQPVPRAGAQLCRKKVKPCRNFHPWNVN